MPDPQRVAEPIEYFSNLASKGGLHPDCNRIFIFKRSILGYSSAEDTSAEL
jgi:hypothetical protein